MDNELKHVTNLIKENKEAEARTALIQILKTNPKNDEAWVWMATITSDREKRQKCLEEALKHNPKNQTAQKILDKMNAPVETIAVKPQQQKIPPMVHLMCAWPLFLVIVGGAIGGGLGGAAYAANLAIYKSSLPGVLKVVLNIVIGLAAIGLWIILATIITGFIRR